MTDKYPDYFEPNFEDTEHKFISSEYDINHEKPMADNGYGIYMPSYCGYSGISGQGCNIGMTPGTHIKPDIKKYQKTVEWEIFAKKISDYVQSTVAKYGESGSDLVALTDDPRILLWNILKYTLRMWKGKGKTNDIVKIVHYAQMMHDLCNGDLSKCGITNEKGD